MKKLRGDLIWGMLPIIHVTSMEEGRNAFEALVGNQKGREQSKNLGINQRSLAIMVMNFWVP
jgi:hypothetical protein